MIDHWTSELETDLRREFPVLYSEPVRGGVDIPAGWVQLVRELSDDLEEIVSALPANERPIVHQLKSKFGGLRCYVDREHQATNDAIARAEEKAWHTCMMCGLIGSGRCERGWMSTMCDRCFHSQH